MDELLPKLAEVTQKVNTYTGTDYSGIEALRREIKEHEKLVKARRVAVEEAKQALDAAHVQQASSSKEVVGLLERKHSWSATDLERYMSLIRSEHVNDQAVHAAKDNVLAAETALEEARSQLEKRERAQYHEEQIWSDTIRRNSTWVTFGLMGVNIFLLLASLLVFEPWRRRRMVREIRSALNEQKIALEAQPVVSSQPQSISPTQPEETSPMEAADKSTSPSEPEETLANERSEEPVTDPTEETLGDMAIAEQAKTLMAAAEEAKDAIQPEDFSKTITEGSEAPLSDEEVEPSDDLSSSPVVDQPHAIARLTEWKHRISTEVQDLFSDRSISVRKVDFTAAFLQGAAAGAVLCGSLFMLIRRN
jgi:sensitive to high expression protein 9